ncbi:hypothetical protein [Corynebacterium dentalis]|uniref:hypothetical protein n=1 Tax=Corynebacterium dentalis TaxID=2014528 RepID=UPI00289E4FA2|nr:hypothetical protein [Corynebacterium dentalis]
MITVVVSVLLAAASWSWVEDPIRKNGIVEPVRAWRRNQNERPFPTLVGAGAAVILAAIVSVGAVPAIVGSTPTSSAAPAMELDPSERPTAPAPTTETAAGDEQDTMSCTQVIHVGDSTSIGMFSPAMVDDPNETAFTTYLEYGAKDVRDSVFGARATTEGWSDPKTGSTYPSAIESVTQLKEMYPAEGTCWVIATGVNDAANISAGATAQYDERVEAMMDLLGKDAPVLWPMVTTNTDEGHYADANMKKFNDALKKAQDSYPNLRLYDWPHECQISWFADEDFAHYNNEGNTQRAKRFAAALARAFPDSKDGEPSDEKIVGSGL